MGGETKGPAVHRYGRASPARYFLVELIGIEPTTS